MIKMICSNCGQYTPDGLPNCINCGKKISVNQNDGIPDYEQLYYKNKVERQQKVKEGFNKAGQTVSDSFNNFQESFSNGVSSLEKSVSNSINNISGSFNAATYQEMLKKGDDAYIMGIVALVLSILGGTIISLVLGIMSIIWSSKAYAVTNKDNHKTAKILGIISVVISSIYILIGIIVAIIEIALLAGTFYVSNDSFYIMMNLFQ